MGLNDITAKAMQDFCFTPLLDPNVLPYLPCANQPNGYYTPHSGELSAARALQSQLGELQPPSAGLNMMTPLSISGQLVGAPMNTNSVAMDFSGFDQQYLPQYHAPNPFPQQAAFAPSTFVNRDSDYDAIEGPIEQSVMKNLDMQGNPSWAMRTDLPDAEGEKFRYNATLRAPTATIKYQKETPMTYLNKGQAYSLSIVDLGSRPPSAEPFKYRSHIRISFDEEEQRSKPAACWQLWKEGRGLKEAHQRGGKLQAVEYVDPTQGADEEHKHRQIQLESMSFDGFSVTWTANPTSGVSDCAIPVRFNSLSTDFSHSKGVKGTPMRLCAKTEIISPDDNMGSNAEVCYCTMKLFRDHGAERKLSNDVAHVTKAIEKLKQQIARAEVGGDFGNRKRSSGSIALKADDRPVKMMKPQSMDSQSVGSGKVSLDDDLHARLEMMQDMFTSTRPVSDLNLRGDEKDDPVLHPVHLPGETKAENSGEFQDTTSATSTLSPESSAISMNSPHHAMRAQFPRLGYDSAYHGSLESLREQSSPCSERALDKFLPKRPARVNRISTDPSNSQSGGYIEAVDVDTMYQPPPERVPKPVVYLYTRFPQNDNSYYRAVYLTERTTPDLAEKISEKWRINPDRIDRIVHVNQTGLKIIVDDDLVRELREGQDMMAEFAEVPTPDTGVDIPSTGLEVRLSF